MALPADINTITVTGKYTDVSGAALSGSLSFTPSAPLLSDTVGQALLTGGAVAVALGGAGTFSVSLPCTGQLLPPSWTWTVKESVTGLPSRSYSISIPHSLGTTVDISTLSP